MGVEFDRIRRYYALTEWTPEKQELAGQVIHDLRREGVEDRARIAALEAENARLREALEFYRNREHYRPEQNFSTSRIFRDHGHMALAALSAVKEG